MHDLQPLFLWLFSHERKSAQFEWSFEWRYFFTVCTQNYIAMCNLKCAIQMTVWTIIWFAHRDVILHTHSPKYRDSNDHSNCAIQITHHCVDTVPNTVIRMSIQLAQFELKLKLRAFAPVWKQCEWCGKLKKLMRIALILEQQEMWTCYAYISSSLFFLRSFGDHLYIKRLKYMHTNNGEEWFTKIYVQ